MHTGNKEKERRIKSKKHHDNLIDNKLITIRNSLDIQSNLWYGCGEQKTERKDEKWRTNADLKVTVR